MRDVVVSIVNVKWDFNYVRKQKQHLWKLSGSKYSLETDSQTIYAYINSLENMYENNSRRLTVCYVLRTFFQAHYEYVRLRLRDLNLNVAKLFSSFLWPFLQLQAIYSANNQVKSTENNISKWTELTRYFYYRFSVVHFFVVEKNSKDFNAWVGEKET